MTETKRLLDSVERGVEGVKCECGGYCESVDSTWDEIKQFGCGRDRPGMECCAAAFECAICHTRWVGYRDAPDMDSF